ncbi:hypothetical protein BT67DRAFT_335415, partial [Trichocladium antarcticum]
TMVRLSVVSVLGCLAMADACVTTCSATSETSTQCNYTCTKMCSSLSAGAARNNFLAALKNSGYDCTSTGVTGVV